MAIYAIDKAIPIDVLREIDEHIYFNRDKFDFDCAGFKVGKICGIAFTYLNKGDRIEAKQRILDVMGRFMGLEEDRRLSVADVSPTEEQKAVESSPVDVEFIDYPGDKPDIKIGGWVRFKPGYGTVFPKGTRFKMMSEPFLETEENRYTAWFAQEGLLAGEPHVALFCDIMEAVNHPSEFKTLSDAVEAASSTDNCCTIQIKDNGVVELKRTPERAKYVTYGRNHCIDIGQGELIDANRKMREADLHGIMEWRLENGKKELAKEPKETPWYTKVAALSPIPSVR